MYRVVTFENFVEFVKYFVEFVKYFVEFVKYGYSKEKCTLPGGFRVRPQSVQFVISEGGAKRASL